MPKRRIQSLKVRMLIVNIGFVLLAFAIVIGAFNVVMDTYIKSTTTEQLLTVVNYADTSTTQAQPNQNIVDNAPRGIFNTHPSSFTIKQDNTVTTPTGTSKLDQTISKQIAGALKTDNVDLNHLHNYRFVVNNRTFYLESSKTTNNEILIVYLDISGITNFSRMVNFILISVAGVVILLLSLAVTLITGRIVKPLSDLSKFASRIGKGDFTPLDETFDSQELATLATAMNTTASELENSEKNQRTFFQNASHELRTPLMAIKSYAEGITYDVMEPKMAAQVIMTETDHMSDLVEDLLASSRLADLNYEQKMVVTDLRELVKAAVMEQQPIAEKGALKLGFKVPNRAVKLPINYKAMYRALSNLLSNALRYADTTIDVTLQQTKKEITLSVANDGTPIDPVELPHLFERFYKGRGGLHGIGLAMVKSIVDQHAGQITIERHDEKTYFIMHFKRD